MRQVVKHVQGKNVTCSESAADLESLLFPAWAISCQTFWEATNLRGDSSASGWRPYVDFTEKMEQIPVFSPGKSLAFVFCFIQVSLGKFGAVAKPWCVLVTGRLPSRFVASASADTLSISLH